MKRRRAIQSIVYFSLGTGFLYSCTDKYQAVKDLQLKVIKPERLELDLIDCISSSILPLHKDTILKDHTCLPFILKMLEDCELREDSLLFIEGYSKFNTEIQDKTGTAFLDMPSERQEQFVQSIHDDEAVLSKASKYLFEKIKQYSIQYVINTEYVQRTARFYQMAPGYFIGDQSMQDWTNRNSL